MLGSLGLDIVAGALYGSHLANSTFDSNNTHSTHKYNYGSYIPSSNGNYNRRYGSYSRNDERNPRMESYLSC